MMKSSPSCTAFVCSDARSEPEPGSLKPWHQNVSPDRMPRQVLALLLLVAVHDDRRPREPDGEEVRPRRRRPRHLFVEDELLHHRERRRRRTPSATSAPPIRAVASCPQPVPVPRILPDADAEHRVVVGAQISRAARPR